MWSDGLNAPNENKHLKWSGIKMTECWIQVLAPFPYRGGHRVTGI